MNELTQAAQAAKQIRVWLKSKGIPARVTSENYSMGSSVRIYVADLVPALRDEVKAFADKYQYGDFNSMDDLYEYRNEKNDLPKAKYVTVNNAISDELRQDIWEYMLMAYSGMEGAPALAKDAYNFRNLNFAECGSTLIYRLFTGGFNQNQFWDFKKLEKLAA